MNILFCITMLCLCFVVFYCIYNGLEGLKNIKRLKNLECFHLSDNQIRSLAGEYNKQTELPTSYKFLIELDYNINRERKENKKNKIITKKDFYNEFSFRFANCTRLSQNEIIETLQLNEKN